MVWTHCSLKAHYYLSRTKNWVHYWPFFEDFLILSDILFKKLYYSLVGLVTRPFGKCFALHLQRQSFYILFDNKVCCSLTEPGSKRWLWLELCSVTYSFYCPKGSRHQVNFTLKTPQSLHNSHQVCCLPFQNIMRKEIIIADEMHFFRGNDYQ